MVKFRDFLKFDILSVKMFCFWPSLNLPCGHISQFGSFVWPAIANI